MEEYRVQLGVFEGPLDLLLQLIERAELDITKIALAKVTDQYLSYLEQLKERRLEDLTAFLVVAARLLQIKSEALLPHPPERDPGEEDPGEALTQQLLVYKRFKEVAKDLRKREESGQRTYLRLVQMLRGQPKLDTSDLVLEDLHSAMLEALAAIPGEVDLNEVVAVPRVRIREKVQHVVDRLRSAQHVSFRSLLKGAKSRMEIVVSFLAILELIKLRRIEARQDGNFTDIELIRGELWEVDPDYEDELEFEE
jgi:segregation and condensation protein A